MTTIKSQVLFIVNCGYFQVIQAVMFLTGAIGIKIAIAKILGIADDVSELFSLLLNCKMCYAKPLTHLWLLLLMTLIATHSCCSLLFAESCCTGAIGVLRFPGRKRWTVFFAR